MAKAPEALLWARLRALFLRLGVQAQRIETIGANGVPDLFIAWQGRSCWVEMKAVNQSRVTVRSAQAIWHDNFTRSGAAVVVINQDPFHSGISVFRAPYAHEDAAAGHQYIKSKAVWQGGLVAFEEDFHKLWPSISTGGNAHTTKDDN